MLRLSLLSVALFLHIFFASPVTASEGHIRMCMESWPPYYGILDKNGESKGIVVEVAHEIARRLGRTVEVQMLPYVRCMDQVKKGHIDAQIGIAAGEGGLITGTHFDHYWALAAFVRADDPMEMFTSLKDFNGKVWLKDGDYEYPEKIDNYSGWTVSTVMFEDDEETRQAEILTRKRADVFIDDYFWYNRLVKKHDLAVRPLMPLIMGDPSYTGFSPGKEQLAEAWDRELGKLLNDGTVDKIYKRWTGKTLGELTRSFGISE